MDLSLNKLPWYGQLGAFFLLGAGAVGAYWNFYATPAQESLDQRRGQLAMLRAEIDRGSAAAARLPAFRREVATLEDQLQRLKGVLPEEKDVADLLRRIQGMATQSNLAIRGFTPQAIATKQAYAEWPIGLQLEGSYHNLGGFLEHISKFPRIINVTAIKIRALEGQGDGDTILAECTATTFVMTEPKAAAAPAVAGAAPAPAPATE